MTQEAVDEIKEKIQDLHDCIMAHFDEADNRARRMQKRLSNLEIVVGAIYSRSYPESYSQIIEEIAKRENNLGVTQLSENRL